MCTRGRCLQCRCNVYFTGYCLRSLWAGWQTFNGQMLTMQEKRPKTCCKTVIIEAPFTWFDSWPTLCGLSMTVMRFSAKFKRLSDSSVSCKCTKVSKKPHIRQLDTEVWNIFTLPAIHEANGALQFEWLSRSNKGASCEAIKLATLHSQSEYNKACKRASKPYCGHSHSNSD